MGLPPVTEDAERQLTAWDGSYDLIMLIQTLFSPGLGAKHRPYAVFTDNIYSLTERFYPAWAPLGRPDGAERVRLEGDVCRRAKHVFATSDFLRDALIEDYGCEPARVVRVGLGANVLLPSLEERRYDSQAALFVGIDFKRKGGDTLLRSWRSVRARVPGAELWIVGPKSRVPAAARQPGITWHGHISSRDQLAELYARAQAFVLPSLFEPFGPGHLRSHGTWPALHRHRQRWDSGEHRARCGRVPRPCRRARAAGGGAGEPTGRPRPGPQNGLGRLRQDR